MTEDEFNTAITMMRNKFQARITVAKSFLNDEQRRVFYSAPFRRERQDKPRYVFETHLRNISRKDLKKIALPLRVGKKWVLGREDYLHHSKVTMAQVLRLLNNDFKPRVRVVEPRKGYAYMEIGDELESVTSYMLRAKTHR